ncbi:YpoC family protein [Lysinibacillus sp. 3P01SB]|uniref:YpoC family protein n=1 Tax=Lysinibacillus sp. 3P01SB TaxID=3132284 RepID=UPI0039A56F8B
MIEVKQEAISKEIIDEWFSNWEKLRDQIHIAHEERSKETAVLMKQGIAHYEQLLLNSAGQNATLESDFELYPINGKERLEFIKMKPGQYACYRQLDELYKETKKRCARLRLKK